MADPNDGDNTAIEMLTKVFSAEMKTVTTTVEHAAESARDTWSEVKKIIQDHETRLRQQAQTDSQQQAEIMAINVQLAQIHGEIKSITTWQADQDERRHTFMQELLMRLIPALGFGGGAGAIIMFIFNYVGG